MIGPKVRAAGLHLGTGIAASLATVTWMSSHSVDLYSIVDQVNDVVVAITKLVATISTFAGGAFAVYRSTTKNLVSDMNEIAKQPDSPIKAVVTENTLEGRALARSINGPVVSAGDPAAIQVVRP